MDELQYLLLKILDKFGKCTRQYLNIVGCIYLYKIGKPETIVYHPDMQSYKVREELDIMEGIGFVSATIDSLHPVSFTIERAGKEMLLAYDKSMDEETKSIVQSIIKTLQEQELQRV